MKFEAKTNQIYHLTIYLVFFFSNSILYGQFNHSRFNISTGYAVYNIYFDGMYGTNSNLQRLHGFVPNPSFEFSYDIKEQNYISFKYEYAMVFALAHFTERPSIQDTRQLWQLTYRQKFKKFPNKYWFVGWTLIDHKLKNYFPLKILGEYVSNVDAFGPQIGLGVHFPNGYRFEFGNDVVWDFRRGEFSFFQEFTRWRIYKDIFPSTSSRNIAKENLPNWELSLRFGFQFAYNHNRTYSIQMPYTQNHVLGDIRIQYIPLPISLFWRRAFWIDIAPEDLLSTSEYLISNNFGLFYEPEESLHSFGASYFSSNESLYRKLKFAQDSTFNEAIYDYRGFSLHYERVLRGNLSLSTQVDVMLSDKFIGTKVEEYIRPRLGLIYKL